MKARPPKDRLILAMLRALYRLGQDSMARIDARWFYQKFQRQARKLGLLKPKL